MPFSSNNSSSDSRILVEKAALLLTAIALSGLEAVVPRIPLLPWLKPGLANIITIIWILRWGTRDALLFTLLRSWITGFYFGFSLVTLSLSLSGGILATLAMGLCWNLMGQRGIIGLCGLGVIGALFHNSGQLLAVYALMVRSRCLFYQMPFILIASVFFGGGSGLLAWFLEPVFKTTRETRFSKEMNTDNVHPTIRAYIESSLIVAGCGAVIFTKDITLLSVAALLAGIIVQIRFGFSPTRFFSPLLRNWLLFLIVALMYLFPAYGKLVEAVPFISYEGVGGTVAQWMRLWVWLQLSLLLQKAGFHAIVLMTLQRIFPGQGQTIEAGILALEKFPDITGLVKLIPKKIWASLRLGKGLPVRKSTAILFGRVEAIVTEDESNERIPRSSYL